MTEKVKRRLTTVLCADVQGYTRLMEADEAGTLAQLRHSRNAMAALVERHEGRIVNTWGDAVIAEFGSVVEAVQCAAEVQQELATESVEVPLGQRMRFRIGINLGDVMVEGNDLYGDGVNIASRLQQLAEPGGILISGPVYDQVRNKLAIGFDYVGTQQVKNVAAPVAAYRVTMGESEAGRPDAPPPGPAPRRADGAAKAKGSATAVRDWFADLPRPIAALFVLSGFLILINVFDGLDEIWFHWPVTALMAVVALWAVLRRRPRPEDGREP